MISIKTRFTLLLCLLTVCFYSCKDKTTGTYLANVPVYMDYEAFRSLPISMNSPKELKNPGKIWIKDNYLFIVEVLEGVHLFDNSNPENPVNLGFIEIFACTDIAVKDDVLFVDNYNDLLSISIANPLEPEIVCRENEAFQFEAANNMTGYDSSLPAAGVNFNKGVIISWTQEKVTEEIGGVYVFNDFALINTPSSFESSVPNGISAVSVGGSMARFTLNGDHLYVVEKSELIAYEITQQCINQVSRNGIFRIGETIFPAQEHLFIGTTTGMLIYDLEDPATPSYVSEYPHVASCDPVVINGNRAYVTLRTGNRCQGDINELVVIDISDLTSPAEIATYQMTNPHGLGVDGETLFLCDGTDGLKVFDLSNELEIASNLVSHLQDVNSYDVIPFNNRLIMSSKEGIHQYNYSNPAALIQLSTIPVQ